MKIYLVGGAVRDEILNLPIKDRDWVIVGATPKIMLKLGYKQVGSDFPVFIHPITKEEYALARTERKVGKGYKGFITFFNNKVTIQEDLMRRDLTINAIAKNKKGLYIDPYGGFNDIKLRLLKHISDAFIEDPLRIFRVARFYSSLHHLGFKIAKKTMYLMKKIVKSKEIITLKPERIWIETNKAMLSLNPHLYFQVLYECNALKYLFLDMKILKINFFYPLMQKLKVISNITNNLNIRLATLFFCFIKYIKKKIYF